MTACAVVSVRGGGAVGSERGVDGSDRVGGSDATECYRLLLRRFHGTLDLVSEKALAGLEAMIGDAERYAVAVARFATSGCVLDVGTGAGLPGVVLAARLGGRRIVWVERRRRRATFLRLVISQCGLGNAEVLARDVRAVARTDLAEPLGAVTALAVGGFAQLYALTSHLHGPEVVLVARRGEGWESEVEAFSREVSEEDPVQWTEPLGRGGTLVVLRVPGGQPCR